MFKQERKRILLNRNLPFYIIYWILYLLFFSTQRYFTLVSMKMVDKLPSDTFRESFLTNLAFLPVVILTTHFIINFILPKFYFKRKFYLFSIIVGAVIIAYPILPYFVRKIVVEPVIYHGPIKYSIENYFAAMLIFVFGMAPLAWFKIAKRLREDSLHHQKVEHDKLEAQLKLKEAELKLLKGQIHPHFLFNTLNNLYSLALEKSDKTPDLLIKLADMLSYIIYDCNSDKVQLVKEIEFINSFLELQRVRYDRCDISFKIEGELNNKQIAPMILHTFIDNSFKHGADKDSDSPWIKVSISAKNGLLFFAAINSTKQNDSSPDKTNGIGIINATKRLELIYPDRHDLVINNSGDRYSVFLKLEL